MNQDYSRKLDEELSRFKEVANIHQLPDIHHYWSEKYLARMIQAYGFSAIHEIYVHYMREACLKNPERTLRFISIGAGNCELEVALAVELSYSCHGNFIFECLDINPNMLRRGEQLAQKLGIATHMQFIAEDLNFWHVHYSYDIIIAAQCLHHFLELEIIFDKIYKYLSDDGYFITHDMIGRNGHMRWPETLAILNEFWKRLPEHYKFNHQLQRHEPEFSDWDCSKVGFEGIRSQDILPLLVKQFHFEFFLWWGGVVDVFTDRSFGHNFDPAKEWDRNFIDEVQQINFEKTLDGSIKPTQMIAAMRKTEPLQRLYWQGLSPAEAVRIPPEEPLSPAASNGYAPESVRHYESFIFVHVPKCGGTSFREYIYRSALESGVPESKIHVPGFGGISNEKNISQLSKQELADFRAAKKIIVAAHGKYDVHREFKLNMENPFYYILFREPVERFISHYNFFNRRLGYRNLKGIHLNDLNEDILKDMLTRMSNIQLNHLINGVNFIKNKQSFFEKLQRHGKSFVRQLSSGKYFPARPVGIKADDSWLVEAEKLLQEEYGAFGVLEKMNLSLAYLKSRAPEWLHFSEQQFPQLNERKSIVDDEPVSERILDAIRACNTYDLRLYELACRLLEEKVNSIFMVKLSQ